MDKELAESIAPWPQYADTSATSWPFDNFQVVKHINREKSPRLPLKDPLRQKIFVMTQLNLGFVFWANPVKFSVVTGIQEVKRYLEQESCIST